MRKLQTIVEKDLMALVSKTPSDSTGALAKDLNAMHKLLDKALTATKVSDDVEEQLHELVDRCKESSRSAYVYD